MIIMQQPTAGRHHSLKVVFNHLCCIVSSLMQTIEEQRVEQYNTGCSIWIGAILKSYYIVTLILVSDNFVLHFYDGKMCTFWFLQLNFFFQIFQRTPYDFAHFPNFLKEGNLKNGPNHREILQKIQKFLFQISKCTHFSIIKMKETTAWYQNQHRNSFFLNVPNPYCIMCIPAYM